MRDALRAAQPDRADDARARSTSATSSSSRRRSSRARRPRARATSWCPRACSRARSTRCPSRPSSSSSCFMMGGYERYYQIARCFRDEDQRADRQPEFTQLDVEMAFVEEDDVIDVMEAVMGAVFEAGGLDAAPPPWPRMTYAEAMARFGSDRPDTRFGLEIRDLSDVLRGSEFKVFESVLGAGGVVRALNAGAPRAVALGARRAQRGRPAPRRQGGRLGGRRGRRLALADREVLLRRADRRRDARARGRRGRPAAVRRRPAAGRGRGARRAAARARAGASG